MLELRTAAIALTLLLVPVAATGARAGSISSAPKPTAVILRDGDGGQDPQTTVAQIVDRAAATDLRNLWPLTQELLSLRAGEKDEKPLRDAVKAALAKAPEKGKLVLGPALAQLDSENSYSDDIGAAYLQVIELKGEEASTAAELLASPELSFKKPESVAKKLKDLLGAGELAPKTRLAVAQALWRHGSSDDKSAARKEMVGFYRSEDPELKVEGAFALAAIDDVEEVKSLLRKLQEEPSDRGRLARLYLDREAEANRWRAKIEKLQKIHEERSKQSAQKVETGDPRLLDDILDLIRERHIQGEQWNREELVAAAARGLLNELDRYSTFMTPQEVARMLQGLNQQYAGIGARVQTIGRFFTIVRPFFSGPAYRSGIRSGDQVTAIITENEKGERAEWSTEGQADDDIIKRLKGEPGSKVILKVARRGWVTPKEIEIRREEIKIPLLESELLPGGIAYFDIQEFGAEMPRQLYTELRQMQKNGGVKGLILDLRYNPGGYLQSATALCQLFLPKGSLVTYTEERSAKRTEHRTERDPVIPKEMPVVVLINEFSASASEITAGALQDHGRAIVIGERSFGKGSVQRFFDLPSLQDEPFEDKDRNGVHDDWEPFTDLNKNNKWDGGARVKLTVERWFLPGGRGINTEYDREKREVKQGGIAPDIESEWPELDLGRAAEVAKLDGEAEGRNQVIPTYIRSHWESHRELLTKLAVSDEKDESQYPDFDQLYADLKTPLPKNEVRKVLRLKLRDKVAEERGKLFPGNGPLGDVLEDPQLRDAMEVLLKRMGSTFTSLPEYAKLLEREKALGLDLGPNLNKPKKTASAPKSDSK